MRRAVIDTTVLVSAFLSPKGVSAELLRRAGEEAFSMILAPEILDEAERTLLTNERIRGSYAYADEEAIRFRELLAAVAILVSELPSVAGAVRDPNDEMILACALKGQADYVVTRDHDLLSLDRYEGIEITSPERFMGILRRH